jgi:hypothetical protein
MSSLSTPWETPWLVLAAVAAVVAAGAAVYAAVLLQVRAKAAAQQWERLEASLAALTKALAATRDEARELDLRRVEHALLDLRDLARRVEDRVIVADEARHKEQLSPSTLQTQDAGSLADRIVTRLLALGYDRITFVTPPTELALGTQGDLDVVVEARRDGAACKGRVLVRHGRIHDIQIQSAYAAFP